MNVTNRTRERCGWVYIIGSDEVPKVKIGYSGTPKQRLRDLTAYSPVELCILAQRRGTYQDERALHKRLAAHRAHGEWFRLEGEVLAVLEEMKRRPAAARLQMRDDGTSRQLAELLLWRGRRPRDPARMKRYLDPRPAGEPIERVADVWRAAAVNAGVHESWLAP